MAGMNQITPGKAGGLLGEPPEGGRLFTPSPLQGEGWDGGRNFDCIHA